MKRWMLNSKLTYRQWVSLAVFVSCLLGVLVYFSLSGMEISAKDTSKVELVKVVVAKQDIPERTVIQDNMLKVVEMPADVVPAEAVHDVSDLIGSPASVMIQQGDILTTKKVFADVRMAGFAGTIPPNCRAVSVPITDITGVSGFPKPGDYVDVMMVSGSRESGFKGEILLQNVQLLAINRTGGQVTGNNSDGNITAEQKSADGSMLKGDSDTMTTATLALPLDEALKLATATQKGTIYLVLRPITPTDIFSIDTDYLIPGDRNVDHAPGASTPAPAQTQGSVPAPASGAVQQSAPDVVHKKNSIEVIRGTESTQVGVN